MTAHTPPTAASDVSPQRTSERKQVSSAGRINSDIARLTTITTMSGSAASIAGGGMSARLAMHDFCRIELACGGGAFTQLFVSGKAIGGHGRAVAEPFAAPLRAIASSRLSHHRPKPNMISDARIPRPGAAKGVVPKNGMGIAFWIDGVPGSADMVKVDVPSTMAAGISRRGMPAARNNSCAIGARTKKATNRLTPP